MPKTKEEEIIDEDINLVTYFDLPLCEDDFEEYCQKYPKIKKGIKRLLFWYTKCGVMNYRKLVRDNCISVTRDPQTNV